MSIEVNKVQPDVSALQDYAGTYAPQLYGKVLTKIKVQEHRMTLKTNLKADHNLVSLEVGDGIRPYNPGEQYETTLSYSKRKIKVGSVKKELLIDAKKYKNTYLSEYLTAGANVTVPPFAEFTWDQVMKKFASEINNKLIWHGKHEDRFEEWSNSTVYAVGDLVKVSEATGKDQFYEVILVNTAGDVPANSPTKFKNITANAATDGFKIIIDELIDGGFAETTIGAINNTSVYALASFRKLARTIHSDVWEDDDMKIVQYCSLNNLNLLHDDIEDKIGKYTVYDLATNQPVANAMYLPGTNNKVVVQAVNWLSGSNRIITTYEGNLHFGTNLMSDLNEIATDPKLWVLGAGLLFDLGVQIADVDPKLLVLNDQD